MQKDGSDAQAIKQLGWRQGSVLDDELVDQLCRAGILPADAKTGIWVIISHDCDVTNSSYESEPTAEVIFGETISEEQRDGNMQWGKSARLLQIPNPPSAQSTEHFQFNIHDRYWIDRSVLANHSPSSKTLDIELVSRLASWVAKRYVRAGFPDSFVERTRSVSGKVRKKAKKHGELLTGIYMLVADVELDNSQDYEVIILASMRDEQYSDSRHRQLAMELLNVIEEAFESCDGVNLLTADLRRESEISITEVRVMKRWDFDDLTLRGENQDAIPST